MDTLEKDSVVTCMLLDGLSWAFAYGIPCCCCKRPRKRALCTMRVYVFDGLLQLIGTHNLSVGLLWSLGFFTLQFARSVLG